MPRCRGLSELRLLTASTRSRKAAVFQHRDEELHSCVAALLSDLLLLLTYTLPNARRIHHIHTNSGQ